MLLLNWLSYKGRAFEGPGGTPFQSGALFEALDEEIKRENLACKLSAVANAPHDLTTQTCWRADRHKRLVMHLCHDLLVPY